MPRHSAAAATPAAARPLQRGQNRVTAGPSPCASGPARATAPAPATEGPALLTCISRRRHRRDVAAGSGRGRLAQAYWGTKSHNASLCRFQSDFSETLPPDKCILEVVILASGKVGCALRLGRQLTVLYAFWASSSNATRVGDFPVPPTNTLHALDRTHSLVEDEPAESQWQPLRKPGLPLRLPPGEVILKVPNPRSRQENYFQQLFSF